MPASNPRLAVWIVGLGCLAAPALGRQAAVPDADPPEDVWEAVAAGKWWLKFRYRFEVVDQDGFSDEALASTLRTVLGFETAAFHDVKAVVEFEDVSPIFDDELFNSGINGETDRPAVIDPDTTEVNQVYLDYEGLQDTRLRAGRQRIIFDNARFVGNVGWRQNEQTFDAARATWSGPHGLEADYVFVHNVNRIFGEPSPMGDAPMASHLLHVTMPTEIVGRLTAYYYHLNYDLTESLSTATVGARWSDERGFHEDWNVRYALEYARQWDVGGNPSDVGADYYRAEVSLGTERVGVDAMYEVLGGGAPGSGDKFTTPLATLHGQNGWADQFLATPDTGIEDLSLGLHGRVGQAKLAAIWHDFGSDFGDTDYGNEVDLVCTLPLGSHLKLGAKAALYDANSFAVDTNKYWLWLEVAP